LKNLTDIFTFKPINALRRNTNTNHIPPNLLTNTFKRTSKKSCLAVYRDFTRICNCIRLKIFFIKALKINTEQNLFLNRKCMEHTYSLVKQLKYIVLTGFKTIILLRIYKFLISSNK